MWETRVILVKLIKMIFFWKVNILHAIFFPAKILFYKKFSDCSQNFWKGKKHFDFKFLKFFLESDNFLLNKIFGQTTDVGVNFLTSVAASVEAYREVGGGLSCKVI